VGILDEVCTGLVNDGAHSVSPRGWFEIMPMNVGLGSYIPLTDTILSRVCPQVMPEGGIALKIRNYPQ
jgi:hypothetical protein